VTIKPMQLLGIDDLLAIYPTVTTALDDVSPGGTSTGQAPTTDS
jgi:hypothetical protein